MQAKVIVDVAEPGGRTVERVVTLPVRAKSTMIGVKKDFDEGLGEGEAATFEAIAVAPDGSRVARKGVEWSLYKIDSTYQWYNSDGHWGYEPVKSSKRIAEGSVDIAADAPAKIAANVGWGKHRLDIKSADGDQTSITFDVGWSGSASADTPDNVVVTLDKANYQAGDEAKLRIASRFAGKATIAVVGDKIEQFIDVDLVEGDNVAPFKVGADWGAGAYAIAITHRPLDAKAKRMPGRALGLAWFGIDAAAHKLDISLGAPEMARPRQTMTLPIKVAGLAAGEEADVTVAAVDIGILNITGFKTPDPKDYFFGQRKLPIEIRDLYGLLIDGMEGSVGAIHTGGDGSAGVEGNLPTQEPLALYSGVVRVDANGEAKVSFDLPAFNGSVRVMAAAWSKTKVGSAEAEVIVRDPVVVAGTLPRFLSLGDRSQMHIDIDNVEGEAGDYKLDLDIHGPLVAQADAMSKAVKLEAHQRTSVTIPVTAAGIGTASLDLRLTGPKLDVSQHFALGVTAGAPDLYRRSAHPLAAGASETISSDLLADFIPGTGSISVAASPFGGLDAPALLQALERYPYGCSEQTVSRAMPLLYANRLASIEHLAIDPDLDGRIKQSIDRVMDRQDSNGAFGLWKAGGDDDDLWLDAFVSDFLTRARERSFAVPQQGFNQALDRLRNEVVNAADPGDGAGEPLAYALYVLARNGRPVVGDLRYLADTKLSVFKTPLAEAQIAAALAMLGDRARAGKVFGVAIETLRGEHDSGYSRPDYGSRLRDGAGVLALLAEANLAEGEVAGDAINEVSRIVELARNERTYTSTQENNWMVLAAEAIAEHSSPNLFSVDGQAQKGAVYRKWSGFGLDGKLATIVNTGAAPAMVTTTTSGNPIVPEPAGGARLRNRAQLLQARWDKVRSQERHAERPLCHRAEGDGSGGQICAPAARRPPAGGTGDRQSQPGRRRRDRRLLLAEEGRRPGSHRISRRSLRGGVRPRGEPVGLLQRRLCRARRRAGKICLSADHGGRHVSSRAFRPQRLRHDRGDRQMNRERRWFGVAGALIFALALAIPAAWSQYLQNLGPIDLLSARQGSTIVVDREGRLLRAFTLPDGRWRLPLEPGEVDPRYIAMLLAYEDARFYAHDGVDWRALTRASLQLAHARAHRFRRLDADHAGRAADRTARGAQRLGKVAAGRPRLADRAPGQQTGRARPLSRPGAVWRQCRRRQSGVAGLFRQRAPPPDDRRGGAAGRAAAIARSAPSRPLRRRGEKGARPRARSRRRARHHQGRRSGGGETRDRPDRTAPLPDARRPCRGGSCRGRSAGPYPETVDRRATAGQARGSGAPKRRASRPEAFDRDRRDRQCERRNPRAESAPPIISRPNARAPST